MWRNGFLLPFLVGVVLAAEPPRPCNVREVAFVQRDTIGNWTDETYNRRLTPNLPLCSDSALVRAKDGKHSASDRVVIRDLFGGAPIVFNCRDLLNCAQPVRLTDVAAKLQERLKGKTAVESYAAFKLTQARQVSTIRSPVSLSQEEQSNDAWFRGVVMYAGKPLQAEAITVNGTLNGDYDLDLCLHVDRTDCGTSRPRALTFHQGDRDLPFGAIPEGLHVLYELKTVKSNNMTFRSAPRAFILAVDSSVSLEVLNEIRTKLALALIDPDATPQRLDDYFFYLTSQARLR